ncbi:uncharacterized protein N0V89_003380 [Didymosphaeria variabile]|uniref:non-specific serine/threonine protein kinase n=1 Tax=Didymosphaeria variabile TaxID=1932322 RepID=A0A9W8XN96_9PLEO|nr:uncharacterized protein N0V89_003380 [Didymosphaeria variabile]KAJ4355364.1 hypothetical protein N0V89_003380 [Didymosphaeria variabile]
MPPKQVYGKRTVAKPSATYTKFISPSKDVDAPRKQDTEVEQRKAKRAARSRDAVKKTKKEADVGSLVGELNGLEIKDDVVLAEINPNQPIQTSQSTRKIVPLKGRKKAGKGLIRKESTGNSSDPPQLKEKEETALAECFNGLRISKNDGDPNEAPCERTESVPITREVPTRSSPRKRIEVATNQEQTAKPKQRADQQTIPETPTRARNSNAAVKTASKPMPQLSTSEPVKDPKDPYTSYVSPLLSLQSYGRAILPFKEWSCSIEPHFTVSKIAEASFSEVYRLSATNTACRSLRESVLKLVPLKSAPNAPLRNSLQSRASRNPDVQAQMERDAREEDDSWKSHVDDVHSEVKLLQNLNYIPGFTIFRELTVLQGRPSKAFTDAWKAWNKARPRGKKSEFPDPSKKASYDDTQLWAVIEMQDAGTDVEKVMDKGGLSTVWEIWDVFWGVCLSVAKAEEACRFEHRDLHLENICIRSSRTEANEDLMNPIVKGPLTRKLGFTGLETTVIDYTLSRADVSSSASRRSSSITDVSSASPSSPCDPSTPLGVAYLDLDKDMGLFTGDASQEYQYEIYRYMRGAVLYNDPLKSEPSTKSGLDPDQLRPSPRKTPQHIRFDDPDPSSPRTSPPGNKPSKRPATHPPDIWRSFHPKTNLVWAHFILHKLLAHLDGNEPSNLSSTQVIRNVEASSEEKSKVVRKALKLYKVLERVAELLEPFALAKTDSLGSMKELAVLAMEERWLRVSDVAGA